MNFQIDSLSPMPVLALRRTVLEFRGADTIRFLNGQMSNDVRKLTPAAALQACVMTAKGKMNAEVWLTQLPDGIRVDAAHELGDSLAARFDRYLIADDVTLTDVSTFWKLEHHLAFPAAPDAVTSRRFGRDGYDLWLAADAPDSPEVVSSDVAEALRIEQGIPLWGRELDENTIPVEAGLDCIDYHKGCYIGQEVISRLKSIGHVNRLLVRLLGPLPSSLAPGLVLQRDGQPVGTVTSAAAALTLPNTVALAYLKRQHATPGIVLTSAAAPGENFTVLPLHP